MIARHLYDVVGPVTRNAVIGKAIRLGLKFTSNHLSREHRLARRPGPKPKRLLVVAEADPFAPPVSFIERREGQCSFPLWSMDEVIGDVCGAPKVADLNIPYCEEHMRCCHNRVV